MFSSESFLLANLIQSFSTYSFMNFDKRRSAESDILWASQGECPLLSLVNNISYFRMIKENIYIFSPWCCPNQQTVKTSGFSEVLMIINESMHMINIIQLLILLVLAGWTLFSTSPFLSCRFYFVLTCKTFELKECIQLFFFFYFVYYDNVTWCKL